MVCLEKGRLTRAIRVVEGVESDQYLCWRLHRFGMDWSRGEASERQWPPPRELRDAISRARR